MWGRGWDQITYMYVYKMAVSVVSDVKAGFHSFRTIFHQNTLLKTSRTNRKCAQECLIGKKWVLGPVYKEGGLP